MGYEPVRDVLWADRMDPEDMADTWAVFDDVVVQLHGCGVCRRFACVCDESEDWIDWNRREQDRARYTTWRGER